MQNLDFVHLCVKKSVGPFRRHFAAFLLHHFQTTSQMTVQFGLTHVSQFCRSSFESRVCLLCSRRVDLVSVTCSTNNREFHLLRRLRQPRTPNHRPPMMMKMMLLMMMMMTFRCRPLSTRPATVHVSQQSPQLLLRRITVNHTNQSCSLYFEGF